MQGTCIMLRGLRFFLACFFHHHFLQAIGGSAMQRKKSLPDVAALPSLSVKQGTQASSRAISLCM